ncbi:TonB-dependent receptor domain-containing protein [Sphingobium ummariense]|uniref:TonB-dependent receptor n=1 Tax=Sphingobium ummariense RL-3 TaxID=1346791 RepID=T0IPM6_9SPHN|nr:TonB-dependent receptor [Sphingobium ummariense]EQB30790.1 TonB-dependent receptor [Sphingobium ummariense RL-3]
MKTFSKRALLRAGVAPAILSVSLAATAAFAQDAPQAAEAESADTIVVTGSLIKNPNLARSTPVTATTADQIELKQNNTAEDILREIPGIVPSIGSAVNNGNGGASFVNLRGLGSNRNIVLLDGDRLVPAELNGRFDLNNIPVALVERVDVLTGGASTTYGADAISGVVNFITRSDFAGFEANVSNQITEDGDGNYVRADITIGANFDDGRGNAVFAVGYQQSDPVYQGSRSFSNDQVDSYSGAIGGSGTSTPSRFSNTNPSGTATGNGTRQITADGTAFRPTTAFDAFNFNPYNIFQTPFERFNMFGAARYEISDAVEAYTRGIFSKNTVKTIIAPSGAFGIAVQVPLSNPYLTTAQRNAFCQRNVATAAQIAAGTYIPLLTPAQCAAAATAVDPSDPNYREVTTAFSRRATELGPRISEFTTTFFDYKAGFRGGITDTISWDVSGAYGESEQTQTQQGYWLNSRVRQALRATSTTECLDTTNGCVPLNAFGPDGSITPEMNAFLNANSQVVTKTSLAQANATINGDFGWAVPWASDAVAFAIGGEYRKYTASQESDLLSQSGDLGGAGGAAPNIAGGYDVYEAFGELVLPLVQDKPFFQDLTVEAGIRYSKYSVDAPSNPSYKTTTWKAGGSWTPVDGFKIRGNYARAVRAPNIAELFAPVNTLLTNLSVDPCSGAAPVTNANLAAVCIAQGAPATTIGSITNDPAGQVNYTGGGNLNLNPEKSNSWTLGAVFQPSALPGFSATVDYYNIKITDAITSPTPGDAISACFDNITAASATDPSCTVIRRNPLTGELFGEAATTPGLSLVTSNLGKLSTDGVDFSLNYQKDIGFANLSLSLIGNWTNSSKFQATSASLNRECVGYYSVNCASIQPEWQFSQRTTLGFEKFDLSLLWRYIDTVNFEPQQLADDLAAAIDAGCTDPNGADPDGCMVDPEFRKIKAEHYFDLTGRFHVSDEITITLTVQNMLNNKPKVVGNTLGSTSYNSGNVYPSTYDALGRRYAVAAKFRF